MTPHRTFKIKRFAYSIALFFIFNCANAQNSYFQQEVHFTMQVRLNDEKHSLHATSEIKYINHSPQNLSFIYFHLWPNAYKNSNTALGQQLLQQKKTALYYSKPDERGYMDSLDFKVNGEKIKWEIDKVHPDICKLFLNEPLLSEGTITISTPFFVKIPDAEFSRLGHTGQAYFITQWYPKPAVYDKDGWHPMPYLDQGEFYSEFGSFDVSITLPQNYILAATGNPVKTPEEAKFMEQECAKTLSCLTQNKRRQNDMDFPPSSKQTKTIRFQQKKVHDFAWFADKRFYVVEDEVLLPDSSSHVNTHVYFTGKNFTLWHDAINYVNQSTLFYSRLVGNYPFEHISAVDGTIMAGGGMEYPGITVIGDASSKHDLETTIAHEVGHNWFYGILGSNERDFPFLDEGINSFYEMRYNREKYPYKKLTEYLYRDSSFQLFGVNKMAIWRDKELAFMYSLKSRTDQALNLPAADYSSTNYGTIVYAKTPVVLDYMMDYMGRETFDKAMQYYYETYKFKHPSPSDFFNALSTSSGLDLSQFEKVLFNSTQHIDYKIKSVKKSKAGGFDIEVKNKSKALLPFNITAYKKGRAIKTLWYQGFENKKKLPFDADSADFFKIDGKDLMPDINRRNNFSKTSGLFKINKPLQFKFLTHVADPLKNCVNYLPVLGTNSYNGFMLGLALHNYGLLTRRLEYLFVPMYAFRTKSPVGFAQVDLNLFPKRNFQQITIGGKLKTFSYNDFETKYLNETNGTNFKKLIFNYVKIMPYISFDFKKKKATSPIHQNITLRSTILFTDSLNLSGPVIASLSSKGPVKKTVTTFINELDYFLDNKRAIDPFSLLVNVQHSNSMSKISAMFDYQISISKKNYLQVRLFAGAFMSGSVNERGYYAFRASGYNGYQDYLFEGNFLGRNIGDGLPFNQYLEKDANLKTLTFLSGNTDWMLALNLKSPKIGILPLRVFADVMTCDARAMKDEKILWDAGLNITLWKDLMEVYIPIAYSAYVKDILTLNKIDFYQRLRFTFNIHKLVPKKFIHNALKD
ncbi:MAG: M1 family metallopeptidase [Bacteroidia bacterium]|nr:M1 family metallopeptidase [Bacteroidia bacterium]